MSDSQKPSTPPEGKAPETAPKKKEKPTKPPKPGITRILGSENHKDKDRTNFDISE